MEPVQELQKILGDYPGYSQILLQDLRELLYTAGKGGLLPFNQLNDEEMQNLLSMINIAKHAPPKVLRKLRM